MGELAAPASMSGRTALVTGAGNGVGAGIARALAQAGASVVLAVRDPDAAQVVVAKITEDGGRASAVRCDVTIRDEVEACVEHTVQTYGALDAVVHSANNRSSAREFAVGDIDAAIWQDHLSVALRGAFYLARAAFPALRDRDGRVVILGSVAGIEGTAVRPAYSATKAALRGFTKSLAQEWGQFNITVNCLIPAALSDGMRHAFEENPAAREMLLDLTPLRRIGDPLTDIGPACVFLASPASRFVTGQTLLVQGGKFMGL